MKQTILRLVVATLLTASAGAWAGTIFKCKNAAGVLQYQEKPCEKAAESVSSWSANSVMEVEVDPDSPEADNTPLILGQGNGGHYYVDGAVNDAYLKFVIDTGATTVALPTEVALRAGVKCKQAIMMNTANGSIRGCTSTIQKLKFGSFTLRYVDAVVMPNLGMPLLGMNVLRQFRVEQDNGQMRLSRKY